ncbi:unnamed protein product, partial [Ectocarpus sp. 12 AP-2014]
PLPPAVVIVTLLIIAFSTTLSGPGQAKRSNEQIRLSSPVITSLVSHFPVRRNMTAVRLQATAVPFAMLLLLLLTQIAEPNTSLRRRPHPTPCTHRFLLPRHVRDSR